MKRRRRTVSGAEALADPLELLDTACHEAFHTAWRELEVELVDDVVGVVELSRQNHVGLVLAAGLADEAPLEWDVRAERLLDYRRGLAGGMLELFSVAFGDCGPLGTIAGRLIQALEESTAACRSLPTTYTAPWRDDALEPRAAERLGRRLGKRLARRLSVARHAGQDRSLPLRQIALRHLGSHVAPSVDEATERWLVRWADWTRSLEVAWVEWADAALPAFVRSELPEAPDADQLWATIREAARALDERLDELIATAPSHPSPEAAEHRLEASRVILDSDSSVAGSFLFRPADVAAPAPSLPRLSRMRPDVEAWDAAVTARLELYVSLLAVLSGTTAVQRRLVWRVRERSLGRSKVLPEVAATLEGLAEDFARSSSGLPGRLERLSTEVDEALRSTGEVIPKQSEIGGTITTSSDSSVEALLAMVRQAPVSLTLHAEEARLPTGTRKVEARVIALQDLARQSFDALRIERIRSVTNGLLRAIDQVRRDVADLPEVFAFAFEAAKRELEEGGENADARAVGLVTEGLASMAESLRHAAKGLETAVGELHHRLATEISDGSLALVDRIAAGRIQARLLAARSRAAALRLWVNEQWGPPADRALRALILRGARLRKLASMGLRRGSEMVAATPSGDTASARGIRLFANTSAVIDELPLVYQRLFTFEALTDASLLANRSGALADAFSRWQRFKAEDGVPLVVRGQPGSGVTSFLNVLGSRIEEDGAEVRRISLHERVGDEAGLAALLAASLGIDPVDTLDGLAAATFDAPNGTLPDAVMIDNLEHLYLRVPKGTSLVERLLTLMAETEPHVFWIGGIAASAWQLVAAVEPSAAAQVDAIELHPLDAEGIRTAIIARHRRSGLPVRFEEPASRRRLLRRRLKRLHDPSAYAELLERDYFDQLYRASSGHLRLALFQWLASADFARGDGVFMRAPERPNFTVLDALDLTRNFTLKAFVEHGTLTLAEHDRIFRLPRHESYQIFESLGNRHLIEAAAANGERGEPARSEIEEDLRYRVSPLLVGAVVTHLRTRNIVH
jgi:hypothetical protein